MYINFQASKLKSTVTIVFMRRMYVASICLDFH